MDFNKNYYSILGVDKNASMDEIKKAYRKLAKEHHPDVNKNKDDSKFKELNESFSIIGDEKERQKYDTNSPHGNNYQPGFNSFFKMNNDFNPFGFSFSFDDVFFRDIFHRREEFIENLDIVVNINITLKNIYNNDNIPIKFTRNVICDHCNFTGFDPNSESFMCESCNGKGHDGYTKCKYCNGTGEIHTGTCQKCNGNKVVQSDVELGFTNSYTIDDSFKKYMSGMGHQSKHYNSKVGTLIVNATYINDDRYLRDGHNLIFKFDLHYQYAIDGLHYEYNHLDDKKYLIKIPPKTKDGDILRLSGKGLLYNGKDRGDLLIKINIIINYDELP